jgi:hypothetical protein
MKKVTIHKLVRMISEVEVLVDDADYALVAQHKWSVNTAGYVTAWMLVAGKKTKVLLSRFLLNAPKGILVDHKDGNTLDHRRKNLRLCSYAENARNGKAKRTKNRSSIYKGVSFFTRYGKWKAQITLNREQMNIGYFDNEIHAALAYDLWAKELHGEFARVNFNGRELIGNLEGN